MNYLKALPIAQIRLFLILLYNAIWLFSCGEYKVDEGDESQPEEKNSRLQLDFNSVDNAKINFPLSLFAFNTENECVMQHTHTATDDLFTSELPKGQYTIVGISGMENNGVSLPLQTTPESFIRLSGNVCSSPLQISRLQIGLNQATFATMTFSYVVSALRFTMSGIPSDASKVEMKLSPVSSGISFSGNPRNDKQEAAITFHKDGHIWTCKEQYIIPSESSTTHLSINIERPGGNEAYGYTYQAALKAGYPYHFTGRYGQPIALDGTFQAEGWHQVTNVEFGFDQIKPDGKDDNEGNGGNSGSGSSGEGGGSDGNEGEDNNDSNMPIYKVSAMPEVGTLWKEYLVCSLTPSSGTESTALLLAPQQFYVYASDTEEQLSYFSHNGMSGWRIFTTEEAKAFRDRYFGITKTEALNKLLLDAEVPSLIKYEGTDRYLCNNGKSTFSMTSNMVSNAGDSRKYYLRPVKEVKLKLSK